eukprot:TRINITY_DN1864_c0_g1_i1.p1 TRINITY_DN1864_c0_g1~~TRINITY_DN1864_c0_g1_i1.p1  ORF type:complete len:262 (-),score=40.47 TRINITY_DN1864_c0_g1_i1:24-809(-)
MRDTFGGKDYKSYEELHRVKKVLERDSNDIYNRKFKYIIIPLVALYLINAIVNRSTIKRKEDGQFSSIAKDSGLTTTLSSEFNYDIVLHSLGGLLLFVCVLYQKYLVIKMRDTFGGKDYKSYEELHRVIGFLTFGSILVMDFAGYIAGNKVSWPGFADFFIYIFSFPWIVWLFAIYLTAAALKYEEHRLFGNMLLKGCIAVPFARLAGGYLQSYGYEEAMGYYVGIGGVSFLVFLWQVYEIYDYLKFYFANRKNTQRVKDI